MNEDKTKEARYIADLITMLRWLAEAWEKNRQYGTPTPPAKIVDWANGQVVEEIETFYEKHKHDG